MVRCVEAFHLGLTASMMDTALALDAVVRAAPPYLAGLIHQRRIEAFRTVPLDRLFEGAYRIVGDPPPPPDQPEAQFAWSRALYQRVPAAMGTDWLGVGGWRLGLCVGMLIRALRLLWLSPDAASLRLLAGAEQGMGELGHVRELLGSVVSEPAAPSAVREGAERFLTLAEKILFASHSGPLAGDSSVLSEVLAAVESAAFDPALLHKLSAATLPLRDAPSERRMPVAGAPKPVGSSDSTVPADDLLRVIDAAQRAANHEVVPGFSISMSRTSAGVTTWTTLRASGEAESVRIVSGANAASAPSPTVIGQVDANDFQQLAAELVANRFETLALPPGTPAAPPTVPPVQLLVRLDRDTVFIELPASQIDKVPGFAKIVARFESTVHKVENALGATMVAPPASVPAPRPPLRVRVVLKVATMRYVAQGAYLPSGEVTKTWFMIVPGPWFESYEPRSRIDEALQRILQEENTRLRAADPSDQNYLGITSFECWVVTHADAAKRPWLSISPTWERSVCWVVDDTTCTPVSNTDF